MTVKEEAKQLIDRLPDDVTLDRLMAELARQLESRPRIEPPRVTDPAERQRVTRELLESLRSHPFPAGAPELTRDELHERR